MTRQKCSSHGTSDPTIIAFYSPAVARQVQALRLILNVQARKRGCAPDVVSTSTSVAEGASAKDGAGNVSELISATKTK